MTSIKDITGISEGAIEKLREVGIRTSEQLIEKAASSSARMRLADITNLDEDDIKLWTHQADLMRIKGVSAELAHLLCRVGVSTVPKLAYRSIDALYEELAHYANRSQRNGFLPTLNELHSFAVTAKRLPKMIHH